jgi:hypothetical protein
MHFFFQEIFEFLKVALLKSLEVQSASGAVYSRQRVGYRMNKRDIPGSGNIFLSSLKLPDQLRAAHNLLEFRGKFFSG